MRRRWQAGPAAQLAAALALVLVLLGGPLQASAHPADMYAQRLSVALTPEALHLDWQILPGPFLADAVWAAADQDQNGVVSDPEAETWIAPFVSDLSISLDGQPLTHAGMQEVHWPSSVEVMRTAEDRIRFSLRCDWPLAPSGRHTVEIHSSYLEANSLNWFSVSAAAGISFAEPAQDNGLLHTVVHLDGSAPPGGMASWNSGTPSVPALSAVVSQMAGGLADVERPTQSAAAQAGSVTDTLTGLVKAGALSPAFLAGAFLLSLVLGSLHALTPGHGKALVGAYLVGSQGRTRDAVFLGAIVTLTHTGSVALLGVVTLFASHYVLPALIAPWLEITSGVLVVGFGLSLLLRRGGDLKTWLAAGRAGSEAGVETSGHDHAHSHERDHLHEAQEMDEDASGHDHTHSRRATMRSLFALGISGGLVPCPDAIAILLVAVAVNRIPFGILLILSFSIGLALVLMAIGIAMVNGARLIARSEALSRFSIYAPVVSAVVVTGLGATLTVSAAGSLRFGTQVVQSAANARAGSVYDVQGARLLYIASDPSGWDQLFMRRLSGSEARQYTYEETGITGYVVSPDGGTILYTVFRSEGGTAIWAVDSEGRERRRVLDCPQSECNSPRWHPDGKAVAYERLDDATEAFVPRFSIWWLDLSDAQSHPMFQDSAFASYAPQFSPDGKWLSYVSSADNTLIIHDLTRGESRFVPMGPQATLPGTWSPSSDAVLFGSEIGSEPLRMRIYSLNSEDVKTLSGPAGATDYSGAWSPAGDWIAIDRNVPLGQGINANQVWLVRPDGTGAHALVQEPGASYSSLTWAPDGLHILYARYILDLTSGTPGQFDIYMANTETGETKLLVEGGDMPALLP